MQYTDVTVVVDGAVKAEYTFRDLSRLAGYVDQIRHLAGRSKLPTEVYVFCHEHGNPAWSCACEHFVPDNRPAYAWNT